MACVGAPSASNDLALTLNKSYKKSKTSKELAGDERGGGRAQRGRDGGASLSAARQTAGPADRSKDEAEVVIRLDKGQKWPSKEQRSAAAAAKKARESAESSRALTAEERGALKEDANTPNLQTKDAQTATAQELTALGLDFWFEE
jgi:hypothetical protein